MTKPNGHNPSDAGPLTETSVNDDPASMPGTPTSTTTSISALSTVATKDGQRGLHHTSHLLTRAHPFPPSLEAERADRISRLAGLERIATLRQPQASTANNESPDASSLQTTPTSTSQGFPALVNGLPPVYFDAQGQPQARTKIPTTGAASATTVSTAGSRATDDGESTTSGGTSTQEGDVGSIGNGVRVLASGEVVALEENASVGTRSVAFDDRMSDDGASSLVGFGEGAGSTISGPIYTQRRNLREGWGVGRGEEDGGLDNPRVFHQRVDSSNSLGDMSARSGQGPGSGGQVGLSHARVLEWTQQPAATRRYKSSREAAESILRERKERGQ